MEMAENLPNWDLKRKARPETKRPELCIVSMKCKVCNNRENNSGYRVQEMMFGIKEEFNYLECGSCGCLQIVDKLDDLSKYYPTNYYSYDAPSEKNKVNGIVQFLARLRDKYAVLDKGFLGKLIYNSKPETTLRMLSEVPVKLDSSILDVGCGSGKLLVRLKNLHFTNLLGVDPFIEKDIQYSSGLKIIKKFLQDIIGTWDLIMFHHSFEHMDNPQETLNTVSSLLKKDGTCIIRIPTTSSYAWKHYRENWVQLDAPRHYFLHSIESMNIMVEKAGLVVDKVIYDSNALQFWGSEQYVKDIPLKDEKSYGTNPSESMFTSVQIEDFNKRSLELNEQNQGDACGFILRKKK